MKKLKNLVRALLRPSGAKDKGPLPGTCEVSEAMLQHSPEDLRLFAGMLKTAHLKVIENKDVDLACVSRSVAMINDIIVILDAMVGAKNQAEGAARA